MVRPLIAVVDDEVEILEYFNALLNDQYEVRSFSSPTEFLAALPSLYTSGLKLLISDFKMPRMTGLEMVQQAHAQFPRLPFIILSGFLDKKTVLDAVELGVFRLLEKPCQPDDLLSCIDQLLVESDLHTVRQEIRQITSQLRELYSSIRIALLQHIPEELMDRLVIDASQSGTAKKISFEDLLETLEHRLDRLLTSEKVMHSLVQDKSKKTA
jgi:DNA-binding NtrC family response regulator